MNLKEKLIETYLSTNELLSVLPLNLFLPHLNIEKKNILNEEIKKKFGISKLTDWANPSYTEKEIAEFIRNNYFPSDSLDEWIKNVNEIIMKSKNVKDVIY